MKLIRSRMVRSMGIYTIANIINAGIPFLLLPILTNYLSTSDYGVLSNFNAMVNLMIPFVGINLMSSAQIQYLKEDINNKDYLTSGFRFNMILAVIFSGVIFFLNETLSSLTGVPGELLYVLAVYALFSTVIEVLLAIWRMEDKAINYGAFRIGRTILELSLVLTFVVGFRMDFEGSIYGMIIAYTVGCLVAVAILFKKNLIFGAFRLDYLKHAINYGVPLIPHTLSGIAIMYSDKLILTHYHGLDSNGIYSVGFMVGQIIGLLQTSFNQAWVPWVFQKLKVGKNEDKLRMVKITYLYIIGILIAVFFLWLIMPVIYMFFGKDFQAGMDLVLWIALGFAFNGMYKMVSVYIFYLEKTMIIAFASFGVAVMNVILNFAFIPEYGPQGAAVATMMSMGTQFLVIWFIASRLIKMPWLLK